uniref:KAP family P-loop domain-containing protein n=1 Tax=Candidatus Kentrum sp. FW TaxID=2126338 RepID=A0A450RT65_9GAMM|nr:MAG: KAP family P-loop domain-containing protein [Candidatus Kentron sp. FW]
MDKLFDDQPNKNIETDDLCRLDGAARELEGLLSRHIETRRDGKDSDYYPPRIGLFGGLGQGKTSVLESVRRRLCKDFYSDINPNTVPSDMSLLHRTKQLVSRSCKFKKQFKKFWETLLFRHGNQIHLKSRDDGCPPHILYFNTAVYSQEELEFEFDRLISRWRFHTRAIWTGFIIVILAVGLTLPVGGVIWFIYHSFDSFNVSDNPKASAVWAVVLWAVGMAWSFGLLYLRPALDHLSRERERKVNIHPMTNFFSCAHPDILLIDNLDRASIEQQRAVLRGILKHTDDLPMAVVVAMDESALLAAPADPETGGELLRKVIQVECRIPPRVREDISAQVLAFAEEGARNNPHLKALFQSSLFPGDLVRIFGILPEFGPRRVKRFLNDLLIMRRQLGIIDTEESVPDMSALARLLGIYDLAPALRQIPEALINALERNDKAYLENLVKRVERKAKGDKKPEEMPISEKTDASDRTGSAQSPLMRFLLLTRHMQPRNGVWRTLVSQGKIGSDSSPGTARETSDVPPPMTPSERFYQVAQGYAPDYREMWREVPRTEPKQNTDLALTNEGPFRQTVTGLQTQDTGTNTRACQAAKIDCRPDERWLALELALVHAENAGQRFRLFYSWEQVIFEERNALQSNLDSVKTDNELISLYDNTLSRLFRLSPLPPETRNFLRKRFPENRAQGIDPLFRLYDELLFYLYRTWIADEAVLEVMGEGRTRELIDRIWNNPAKDPQPLRTLLFHCPADRIPFEDRLAVVANPGVLAQRDLPLVQYWLATGKHLGKTSLNRVQSGADAAMLSEAWPPIARGKARDPGTEEGKEELAWHCDWLRALHRHGVTVTPESLTLQAWGRGWLKNHCQRGNGANVLHGLGRFFRGQEMQGKWEKAAWEAFTQGMPTKDIRELLFAILSSDGEGQTVELTQEQRETSLMIACLLGDDVLCREWVRQVEKIRDPGFIEFLLESNDPEDNPIWRKGVTETEELVALIHPANKSKERDDPGWQRAKKQMENRLPLLLTRAKRGDAHDILEKLAIESFVPPE